MRWIHFPVALLVCAAAVALGQDNGNVSFETGTMNVHSSDGTIQVEIYGTGGSLGASASVFAYSTNSGSPGPSTAQIFHDYYTNTTWLAYGGQNNGLAQSGSLDNNGKFYIPIPLLTTTNFPSRKIVLGFGGTARQIGTYATCTVNITNNYSIYSAVLLDGTNYVNSAEVTRGGSPNSATFRIIRGDTLHSQTVDYTLSGNATNNVDYTGSLTGSVTINAGSSYADLPVTAVANTNAGGTKFLTLSLMLDATGTYQIGTNNAATLGILQDTPILTITAPGQYSSPNNAYQGEFTITRTGILTNSLVENLFVSGTATAGSDYVPLPNYIRFAANQASTNLYVLATNATLSAAKTVVLALATNNGCVFGLTTNAVVTILPNSSTSNSVTSPVGEYWRGSGSDPTYWSTVVPMDAETGMVYSNLNGNCSSFYPGLSSWSSQTLYHYNVTNTANPIPFNNPIVAFGERVGGTPLYCSQPYSFGIYAGDPTVSNNPVVIQVYYRTNDQLAGTITMYPPSTSNQAAWTNFANNGYSLTTNAFGLTTILSGAANLNFGENSLGSYVLTHTGSSLATNYYYVVGASGYPADITSPMAVNVSSQIVPSLLYSMEFESRPQWRSVFLDQPQFNGSPLPPYYAGMTSAEMLTNTPPVTNVVSFRPSAATNLDDSPELRRHPALDNFVASMGNDPIALANFVINQIGLTDPIDYNDNGNVSEDSINPGGVTRGALGTFMERQGSPAEECALLVYLLRQAGVPAVYEFAPHNGVQILDTRLSQMLKFQVQGGFSQSGQLYTTNTMIPVNYPWVAAYIGTNWVHIFPWLKDYEMTEGLNLFDEMPTNYSNAYEWVHDYVFANTNLLSLAVNGDNTPRVILPKYLQQTLAQNNPGVSAGDIGIELVNRQHFYARWQDFPTPTWVTNISTPIESLSSSAITNVSPLLTNIFDTLSVEIYSLNDPTKDIQTGDMRLVDLHNREFYISQTTTNTNYVQLNLVLMPFRPGITNLLAYGNDTNLLSKEVLSLTFDPYDYNLGVRFRYHRNRAITSAYAIDPTQTFYGESGDHVIDFERPLIVGDQAAICLDYGQVTTEMLNADAQSLWQMENTLSATPSATNSVSPDVYEGATMYLAGMSYYEKCSEFNQLNQSLQKFDMLSFFGAGLSKIIPARNSYGIMTNGTDPVLPCVDMFFYESMLAGNGTANPNSGQAYQTAQWNFNLMEIADLSAEEHQVINRFYQQTNAVSTVRLLQLAQSSGAGIVSLNVDNYTALGQTNYQSQPLSSWDSNMWQQVVGSFQSPPTYGYVTAFITPGPITNSAYKGMGSLILNPNAYQALISPQSLNGGFSGQPFTPGSINPANTPNFNVDDDNGNTSIGVDKPASQSALAPDQVAPADAAQVASQASTEFFAFDQETIVQGEYAAQIAGLPAVPTDTDLAQANLYAEQNGNLGAPQDGGAQTDTRVSDPVNNITGEFYVNETDLQLAGPIQLALLRNYSSQNLADNQFGYGWKLNIMPYLSVSKGSTNIYAADMDGAVLAYVRGTNGSSTNLWVPTLAANPQLNNYTTAGVGGLANRLRDYISLSVVGSATNYTLHGADGSIRVFQFMNFNSGTITNTRPYLLSWTDNCGNYFTFAYDTNLTDANFGQMARIQCSNGNYLSFDYDIYGHMIDAYSGDGRWMYYEYDEYGDLVTVTLPDSTTRSYQYLHSTQFVTNGSVISQQTYSTHLIIEEEKPDGRELINAYDSQRRVTNQMSTAGTTLSPITTATMVFSNNFNFTNSYTNTISGYTLVIDGNNHTNRYDYTNNLITKITDPLGQTIQQTWYPNSATAPGYPRSLQQTIDKRGLVKQYEYDGNGNVTNTLIAGDLTGDGISTQTATNTAVYNTNSLPVQMTDPAGNGEVIVYDPVFNFLPQQIIRFSGATYVSTNFMIYGDATNVVVDGSMSQTNLAYGLMTREIRAANSPDAATNDLDYNGNGFLTESISYSGTTDPNVVYTYFYNERGQMVNKVDSLGAYAYMAYDAMGRPIEQDNYDQFGNNLSWNFLYYNDNGELSWTEGPRYNPEDYVYYDYDGAGRRTTEIHWRSQSNTNGTGITTPAGYNLYSQIFYQYDSLGNLLLKVDPRGAMTTNTYDSLCRLVQSTHLDTNGVTVLSTDQFSYEPGGLVQSHTNALGGVTTTYYNITGKPEYQINPDGSTNGWRYYLDGRINKQIQSNGAYWQATYDDVNRITTRTFYSAAGVPEATNCIQLDRRGNVIQRVDEGGNVFTNAYDGLGRIKVSAGPAIVTVNANTGLFPGGPATYVTNVLQEISTNFYDAAGRAQTNVNALGEIRITLMDALGRVTTNLIFNATGTLVREHYTTYSADHNSITVTDGSGTNAIVHTTWTDADGRAVLSIANPSATTAEFTLNQYDLAGNLIFAQHDSSTGGTITTWTTNSFTYDGLNRLTSKTDRDGATTTYAYDPMGDMTNRTLPGSVQMLATYNSAGQKTANWIVGGTSGTRTNTYAYFAGGNPFAGMLQTRVDGRQTTNTYSYDDRLRLTNQIASGLLPEQNMTLSWQYEPRNYITGYSEQFASTNNGPATFVQRTFNPYGELATESVNEGSFGYSAGQTFDSTGRRTMLNIGGANYGFAWRADNVLAFASDPTGSGSYSYDTSGMLTNRAVAGRNTGIISRDGEGRPLVITNTFNSQPELGETLAWSGDGLLSTHTLDRPDFTDNRLYSYANMSRRVTQEQLTLSAGTTWTNNFVYDQGVGGGPGALTTAGPTGASFGLWWSGTQDAFARVNTETNNAVGYLAYGSVNGQSTLSAWLDNQPIQIMDVGTNAMQWRTFIELSQGSHQLKVSALHPSGFYTAWATNSFTNNIPYQVAADSYDGNGNITNRVWLNASGATNRTQTLSWDAKGRLRLVMERNANNYGYNWTAVYDGLNRRVATVTTLVSNGVPSTIPPQVLNSYYDPQVEFLELGVLLSSAPEVEYLQLGTTPSVQTIWKLYGPDLNGVYGGKNGTGGLEGVSPYLNSFNPVISDVRGNVLAEVTNGVAAWSSARPSGYGAVPGYRPVAFGNGVDLAQSCAWRGREVDVTGYYHLGMRDFDPDSGQWLSYDPIWNAGDPNGQSFCSGDPLNSFDSDGRFSRENYSNGGQLPANYYATSDYEIGGVSFGEYGSEVDVPGMHMFVPNDEAAWIMALQYKGLMEDLDAAGQSAEDALLNTQARNEAAYQFNNADLRSGLGVATWAIAGVSYAANTADAAANMVPIIGEAKILVEKAAKTGVKRMAELFAKDAIEGGTASASRWVFQAGTPDAVIDQATADAIARLDKVTSENGTVFGWGGASKTGNNLGWTSWQYNTVSLFDDADVTTLMEEAHHAETAATWGFLGDAPESAAQAASRNAALEAAWEKYANSIGLIKLH